MDSSHPQNVLPLVCLVADVHMSVVMGIELCSQLIETGHAIPTILVTA
jgi:FixJ family two-component response regulator